MKTFLELSTSSTDRKTTKLSASPGNSSDMKLMEPLQVSTRRLLRIMATLKHSNDKGCQ